MSAALDQHGAGAALRGRSHFGPMKGGVAQHVEKAAPGFQDSTVTGRPFSWKLYLAMICLLILLPQRESEQRIARGNTDILPAADRIRHRSRSHRATHGQRFHSSVPVRASNA